MYFNQVLIPPSSTAKKTQAHIYFCMCPTQSTSVTFSFLFSEKQILFMNSPLLSPNTVFFHSFSQTLCVYLKIRIIITTKYPQANFSHQACNMSYYSSDQLCILIFLPTEAFSKSLFNF